MAVRRERLVDKEGRNILDYLDKDPIPDIKTCAAEVRSFCIKYHRNWPKDEDCGPGFGEIGPMGNFAALHPVSKVVLTLEMWIGRLEVLTVLVLFRAEPWRSARWASA